MKKCPYCSAEIEDNASFCLYCMASLEPKKVIKSLKTETKRWHFSIAAFLVFAIFAVLIWTMRSAITPPVSSSGFSQSESSFYFQSDEVASNLAHSSDTEQTDQASTSSKGSTSISVSTSSKNSTSTSNFTSNSTSTSTSSATSGSSSTSSKVYSSVSSVVPVSSEIEQNAARVLTESDCTYKISGSEAILIQVNNVAGDIIIPNSLGGYPLTTISTAAFGGRISITSLKLPDGIKEIGLAAFKGCTALKSINIPEGVTALKGSTLSDCTSLTSITLPSTLTSIGNKAFMNSNAIANVYYAGSELQKGSISFGSDNDAIVNTAVWHYNHEN